ncbi:hypothetical protein [Bacteroides sp. 51]|uniref:hypothetical protein n=1 Tax=Bacteroides sp. 51 TaxID=2302938 RepID=UPI0013D740FA|nr:hypothetical protein [Bacteroides sp. 51]NDV82121.1 hypothetical protein [Bacteroides sp. 51]
MKRFRILFAIAFFALFSTVTMAQNDKAMQRARQKVLDKYEQMFIDLKLTDEQKEAIVANWAERNLEIGKQTKNAEDPVAVRHAINKEYHEKLRKEISDDILIEAKKWERSHQ